MVDELLSERSLAARGLFDPARVRSLAEADRAQRVDAAYTLFAIMCIELWSRLFLDRSAAEVSAQAPSLRT
jgi:asparagine synthase (glutamine-hydrolysing)